MSETTGHSNDNLVPHSNVYVRGLSQRVDEEMLSDVFRKFGNIISIRLFKTGQFSKKPTFAFIKYGAFEEAQASIAALNGSTLLESIIEVRLADNDTDPSSSGPSHVEKIPPPSDNIYCKNLPLGWAENDLRALFQPFGHVSMIRILLPAESMGQGGAALVRMASLEEARTAIQSLQGHQLIGAQQPIVIRFADSADIKAKKQNKASGGNTEITALGHTSTNYHSSSTMMNSSAVTSSPTPDALPTNDSPPHQYNTPPNKRNPYGSLAAASTAVAVTTSTSSSADADAFNYRSTMQHQSSMMTQSSNTRTGCPFPLPPSNAYGLSVFGGPSTSGYFPPGMAFASRPEYSNFQGYVIGFNTPLFPPHQRPAPPFNGGRSMSMPLAAPSLALTTYPRRPSLSSQDFLGSSSGGHYGRPVSSSSSSMAAATASTSAASSALPPAVIAAVTSLYVKNLPPDADRLFLYEKFAPFGAILSVKILEDEEGVSKGVGFVNFADADCASKAASTLHNLLVGDRHLRVAFQTHKKS